MSLRLGSEFADDGKEGAERAAMLMGEIMAKLEELCKIECDEIIGHERKLIMLIMREMWIEVLLHNVGDDDESAAKRLHRSKTGAHLARMAIKKIFDKSNAMAEINPDINPDKAVFEGNQGAIIFTDDH